MPTLLYLHGFLSSPESHKAQITQNWLLEHAPDIKYLCPCLSPYPDQTQQQLIELIESIDGDIGLIGSSLGGFWSTWLVERYGLRAVLINPSVKPFNLLSSLIGQSLNNFYTNDTYVMRLEHVQQLQVCYQYELQHKDSYWVKLQTGDETLDYREAVERFQGSKVDVEQGGDHGFQNYKKHLPNIIEFLFLKRH
jgi:predicted esterase YcpF (UPF0227 family)